MRADLSIDGAHDVFHTIDRHTAFTPVHDYLRRCAEGQRQGCKPPRLCDCSLKW